MKRREAFKKIGILSLVGVSSFGLLEACTNATKETTTATTTSNSEETESINAWPTERNKLIVNRSLQKIADPNNPTKAELKHSPDITFGEKDLKGNTLIKVSIGQEGIIHPATKEHWIDYITLFINDIQYSHTEYINGGIRGYESYFVAINKGDKIRVESGCNIHGIWNSEVVFE